MSDYLFIANPKYSPERVSRSKSVRWSCSKTAQPSDRAFVYVVGQGISFEWVIDGSPRPDPEWRFMCPVRLVNVVSPPISIHELREAIPRSQWAPPYTNFRGFRSLLLPPAVAATIRTLRGSSPPSLEALEIEFTQGVAASRADTAGRRRGRLAKALQVPQTVSVTTSVFIRNPDVAAEVLERTNGRCESCGAAAPFRRATDGTPYLEVHHRTRLADGGVDTVENAVAVCPNCHCKAHYGPPNQNRA